MTTRVYLDLPPRYSKERSPAYTTRLGSPTGPLLTKPHPSPIHAAARALLAKGITGPIETWDAERPYPRLRGDIEKLAPWDVSEERDRGLRHVKHREWGGAVGRSGEDIDLAA